ncbi:MAG TPA: ABC transporter permease [Gemmatimonadaceae bacterium]|jgi:predicted permease
MRIPDGVRRAFRLPTTSERIARDLDDEVRFHVDERARKLIDQGYATEAAYAEALRRFGDVDDLRDYCVAIEVSHMQRVEFRERLENIGQDFRFAFRQLRKSPSFGFLAALTLALGVGATTAIFSVVNGVVMRPLPFPQSEEMVRVYGLDSKGGLMGNMADPTFDVLADRNRSFSAIAKTNWQSLGAVIGEESTRLIVSNVSRDFFRVIDVKPRAGRFFDAQEQQLNAAPVIIISDGLWQRAFDRSSSAIGGKLSVAGSIATIVGVMPAGQEYPANAEVWMPAELNEKRTSYTSHSWQVIGRMKPSVTVEQANADVSQLLRDLHARVGDMTWTFDGRIVLLREQIIGKVKPLLLTLFGASAVLLLIACANVANLLIARMASRQGEMAVRLALGAARTRLAQQLLIEASVLAGIGCLGGLALALAGMKLLLALRPTVVPRVGELSVDARVLGFAILISASTAIVLGLVAAWRGASGDLRAALAQSQRTQGGGGASYQIRASLVVLQVAMTVVLLIGAGLLTRSFIRLMTVDAGYRTKGMVVAQVAFEEKRDAAGVDPIALQREDAIMQRLRSVSGATSVAVSDAAPFSGGATNGAFIVLESAVPLDPSQMEHLFKDKTHSGYATRHVVNPAYFPAVGISLVSGRLFNDADRQGAPHVAVINKSLAAKQFPNQSAIGKVIEYGNMDRDMTPITIVGVVGDTKEETLASDADPAVYLVNHQRRAQNADRFFVIATSNEGATIAGARAVLRETAPGVAVRFQTMEDIIGKSMATQRFMLILVGVFGLTALLLATLGVYSVVSYLVAQRGKEISIRVALGARGGDIVGLVVRQGMVLAIAGAIVGAIGAIAATRLLKTLLYEISATDPVAFVSVIAVLCVVAVLASYLPARRAAKTSPMDVLRAG